MNIAITFIVLIHYAEILLLTTRNSYNDFAVLSCFQIMVCYY